MVDPLGVKFEHVDVRGGLCPCGTWSKEAHVLRGAAVVELGAKERIEGEEPDLRGSCGENKREQDSDRRETELSRSQTPERKPTRVGFAKC